METISPWKIHKCAAAMFVFSYVKHLLNLSVLLYFFHMLYRLLWLLWCVSLFLSAFWAISAFSTLIKFNFWKCFSKHLHSVLLRCAVECKSASHVKGPDILKTKSKNELIWCHFEQNQSETKFAFESLKPLTKANFLGEFVLAPKHLWASIGPWRLRNRLVGSGTPPFLTWDFFPPVRFSFHGGQTGEQHLEQQQHQVTSNMNTLLNSWAGTNIRTFARGEALKIWRRHLNPKKKLERSTSYAKQRVVEKHPMQVFQCHEKNERKEWR